MNAQKVANTIFNSKASWQPYLAVFLVINILLLVCLPVVRIWVARKFPGNHPTRLLITGMNAWGPWLAVLGLVVLFFRYQQALYLSSPLVLFGWIVLFVWWFEYQLKYLLKVYPKEKERYAESLRRQKWIPTKRKH
jgi:hypothetical protein